jgi:hypothetical protein
MKAGETMGYLITLGGRKILLALVPILTISSHKQEETSVFLSIHTTSWFFMSTFPLRVMPHFLKSILAAGYMN